MTQTTNYQLPQWSASDRVKRGDFNSAMSKIDTQMKANANNINTKAASSTVTSLQTTVSSLQTTVNNKADKSTVTNLQNTVTALQTTVNGKADSSAVQTALAEKADASDLTALQTTVAGKADSSALDAKADASAMSALQTTVNGKADASAVAALAAQISGGGRIARVAYGSYVGDDTYGAAHPTTLTFPFYPVLLAFGTWNDSGASVDYNLLVRGASSARKLNYNGAAMRVTWADDSISYYHIEAGYAQYNSSNSTYYYVAIGYELDT